MNSPWFIRTAVASFDVKQLTLVGPTVTIQKDFAVSFVLLIHELTTNAVKYGALSTH
jgi:two-component sensor histidine kinase